MDTAGSRSLHTLFRVGVVGDLSDGQLLERFVAGRDESAEAGFAALVERHGPMVLRVCRRSSATRTTPRMRSRPRSSSWPAGRVDPPARVRGQLAPRDRPSRGEAIPGRRGPAARARTAAGGDERPESSDAGDRPPSEGWPELHEEIDRLPEKYRGPIVLCYLEGLTTEAAALRLGCAQGTVMSRLSRARERLRQRLIRRGLAPAVGLLGAGLSADAAQAAVPTALAHSLIGAAMQMAAGTTAAGRSRRRSPPSPKEC